MRRASSRDALRGWAEDDPGRQRRGVYRSPEREKRGGRYDRVYLASLIIELSFTRRCFLSIRFDDCGETSDRYFREGIGALPVQFIATVLRVFHVFAHDDDDDDVSARRLTSSTAIDTPRCIRECNHERNRPIIFSGYNSEQRKLSFEDDDRFYRFRLKSQSSQESRFRRINN